MTKNTFTKVLVANRGEIAARIIRKAKDQGYETVAVFTEADRLSPHVQLADQAVCIGAGPIADSYLNSDKIFEAAKKTQAEAIHPGYGFFSENAGFAKSCQEAGIVFIGATPESIELMGSKRQSKLAMLKAGVPCIEGYQGEDQSVKAITEAALSIGFPVMLKASMGGGGRGMRLVLAESELTEAINSAKSEAEAAFGSGELIVEKAVLSPRHIEIQVFGDQQGNTVYLGERDCSIQRRHQKVVEEAPSPFVDEELREKMGLAAVNVAKACDYVGAGTVEFLVDKDQNFYFLEMNTRLQVEHPVTELITGLDLIAWQLAVASGESLPITQDEVNLKGHAIEVRLYAEDPQQNFVPQTGTIAAWQPAVGEGVRIDAGINEGQEITPFYDPMLGKIIAYGENREQARRRLIKALEQSCLLGFKDNRSFLMDVLKQEEFINGEATTAFIAEYFAKQESVKTSDDSEDEAGTVRSKTLTLSAALLCAPNGWHNNSLGVRGSRLLIDDEFYSVGIKQLSRSDKIVVSINDAEHVVEIVKHEQHCLRYEIDGVIENTFAVFDETGPVKQLFLQTAEGNYQVAESIGSEKLAGAGSNQITASMDGCVVDVLVKVGDKVSKGQTLLLLDAMKMEHPHKSSLDATVVEIHVTPGDQVKGRQLLVELAE